MYGFEFALLFLAWWSNDIAFSLSCYFLWVEEYLIVALQLLFCVPSPFFHYDVWESPFIMPSFFLTIGSTVFTWALYYYAWQRHPRVSHTALLHLSTLGFSLGYISYFLHTPWWTWTGSICIGVFYGVLTAYWTQHIFLRHWFPLLLHHHLLDENQAPWNFLFGKQNTFFPRETERSYEMD